jgi:hypothetical protein
VRRLLLLLFAFVSTAFPWLKSYDVPPTLAAYSGKVRGDEDYGVGQTITANFDSAVEVQLFVGDTGASHAAVAVEIREYATNTRVAYNTGVPQTKSHYWLKLPLTPDQGQKFVRGKTYIVKYTRPGDSIHYYDDIGSAYPYGHMVVGGTGQVV